jgi:hypothetical protein
MVPDLFATSSRHSGLSPSRAIVSRIIQSMPLRPRPKPRHCPATRRARRWNDSLGGFGMFNALGSLSKRTNGSLLAGRFFDARAV